MPGMAGTPHLMTLFGFDDMNMCINIIHYASFLIFVCYFRENNNKMIIVEPNNNLSTPNTLPWYKFRVNKYPWIYSNYQGVRKW